MENKITDSVKTLRNKVSGRLQQTELPFVVYAVVFFTMFVLWRYSEYEELAMDFFVELGGAAFTLFIVDMLLVRSKAKRWKLVRDELNYVIARLVNRTRDGIATRIFNFNPKIDPSLTHEEYFVLLREKRSDFLNELVTLDDKKLAKTINEAELFSDSGYDYFNEKADEIWNILNVKYSDYFHPELVTHLISLHLHLKDLCGNIRQFKKGNRFVDQKETFKNIGRQGAAVTIKKIIELLNILKNEGFSEPPALSSEDFSESDVPLK
ncbi:MAG: hypothetical protein EA391_03955 [Balneolaceae bacterium]|nr:MAG: hypothetical protein EA391_03955 [Balneolaceae bacterium]